MLNFIHITDTHIGATADFTLYGVKTLDYLEKLVTYLNERLTFTPDFVLHTGDVTNTYEPECAQLAAQTLAKLKYPIYYTIGNHDNRAATRQFLLNQPPTDDRLYYDFTVQDFHFMVLDTQGSPDPLGYVSEEQLKWLEEKCAGSQAKSLVLVVHHLPLKTHVPWLENEMIIVNHDALYEVLSPYRERLRGVFFGHIHRAFTGFHRGILCSSAPSAFRQFYGYPTTLKADKDLETPGGFSLVSMTHEETIIRHYVVPV